jgi:hypothetical protein
MENVKLLFFNDEDNKQLECFATADCKIFIEITDNDIEHQFKLQNIVLNKSTAIRLVRELKKQIGFLESEVSNG